MAIPFRANVDFNKNELQNARVQNLASDPGTPVAGQLYFNSTGGVLVIKFYTGSTWITLGRLDQISAPTSDVSFNSQKATNLATPTAGTDGANKDYVDSVAQGLDIKASVRAATTVAGTLASSFIAGASIDGVTLVLGDRILLKNQAAQAENGIRVVTAGTPTRATDFDAWTEVPGAFVFVEEGTANADTGWVCSANAGGTLDTTAITFVQFSAAGIVTASGGLTKTGNDIAMTNMVQATVKGRAAGAGTGAPTDLTVAQLLTMLGMVAPFAQTLSTSATSYVITHSKGTKDLIVQVYDVANSPYQQVFCDVEYTDTNNVTLRFAVAPTANQYRVIIK
jgi:hypothetical protein